jgi:hypothetical protein
LLSDRDDLQLCGEGNASTNCLLLTQSENVPGFQEASLKRVMFYLSRLSLYISALLIYAA